jgi:hypothetical protein
MSGYRRLTEFVTDDGDERCRWCGWPANEGEACLAVVHSLVRLNDTDARCTRCGRRGTYDGLEDAACNVGHEPVIDTA